MVSAHLLQFFFSCFDGTQYISRFAVKFISVFLLNVGISVGLLPSTDLGREKKRVLFFIIFPYFLKFSSRLSCDIFAIMQFWSL